MVIKFSSKIDMPGSFPLNPSDPAAAAEGFLTPDVIRLQNDSNAVIEKLAERYGAVKDSSFMGTGRQPVVGSVQGEMPVLDEGSYREVYSQTPVASVIIKKREFSSLKHLYNPIYMSEADKWLYRCIKRLVQRKCFIMAEYERLSKVSKMMDLNLSVTAILASLIADEKETDQSEAYKKLEAVIMARTPAVNTTYYVDPFDPEIPELGLGQGIFEISTVTSLNTTLNIGSEGGCNFTLEDPNSILLINDEDIEFSIRETQPSPTNVVKTYRDKIASSLREAQSAEADLNLSRTARVKSRINFEIQQNGWAPIATMELGGEDLFPFNIDNVGSYMGRDESLTSEEKTLFNIVYKKLTEYSSAVKEGMLNNKSFPNNVKDDLNYVRNKMRLFYLGKYLIQPMDEVHIYIDGGTRNFRENYFSETNESFSEDISGDVTDGINKKSSLMSSNSNAADYLDDDFLQQDFNNYVNNSVISGGMTFAEFKKIRMLQLISDSGSHVFAGLVKEVQDTYSSSNGKYVLSVSCATNMEWLRMSRFNKEPSLDQTQGLVQDPLTPMSFRLDSATGLPSGVPDLLPENKTFLSERSTLIPAGERRGLNVTSLEDMEVGKEFIGGNSITTYQHVPGLVYRWKEGVMTAVYNMFLRDPKNLSLTDMKSLRRDIGFFWSNSAFDNLDSANILSILVTGIPYNNATFIQSTKHAFIPNSSLDTSKDFFSTFLDFQSTNVKINGNFIPFKVITVSPEALATASKLQIRLTGFSSEMQQLRAKSAEISDKIFGFQNIGGEAELEVLIEALKQQQTSIDKRISDLEIELKDDLGPENIQNAIVQVAGNDVMFDLLESKDNESAKNFGDRLAYLVQRRKEDVIYGKDKNLFIVSDEYDKDYDIQAFVLQMRQNSPEMFKSTWLDVYQLCNRVAEILDFEFFTDTQGHIVFRPPQYNRVPITVLKNMLQLYKGSGIKLISDSVLKLYSTREESIIRDIVSLEWEIAMNGALIGKKIYEKKEDRLSEGRIVNVNSGFDFDVEKDLGLFFILNSAWDIEKGIKWSEAVYSANREETLKLISSANLATQLSSTSRGLFSSGAQKDLQNKDAKSEKESYDLAVEQLSILKGIPVQNFEKFDKVAVGSKRNGQATPTTDRSNIVNKMSELISRRARLLRTLGKIMEQVDEVGEIVNGKFQVKMVGSDNLVLNDLNRRFIEDDTKDYIGPLSGNRFIIKDEHIINHSFTEKPPELTALTVKGGDPIIAVPQEGTAIGTNYIAFGADFDMWRQYGWRNDKTFERPYFNSAELQCAPYALMLLSRQRKNIVTGNLDVIGNEYYQLGDVVYVASRRLLFYVTGINHSFSYGGEFKTKLTLTYGHPPGEYIPTPLDIIGKMSIRQGSNSEYRMNRQISNVNKSLGIIKYEASGSDVTIDKDKIHLQNKYGKQNYDSLILMGTKAKEDAVGVYPNSPRLFVVTYGVEDDSGEFKTRRSAIKDWLTKTGIKLNINNKGPGVEMVETPSIGTGSDNMVASNAVIDMHIKIPKKDIVRSPLEKELLQNLQFVASQEAYSFDSKLENVVEVRLVQVPNGGWQEWDKTYNNSSNSVI